MHVSKVSEECKRIICPSLRFRIFFHRIERYLIQDNFSNLVTSLIYNTCSLKVSLAEQAKGNESYMYVGVKRLSKTNANNLRNQAEGK